MLSFQQFCQRIKESHLTLAQIRFDVPVTQQTVALLDAVGDNDRYENYVCRYEGMRPVESGVRHE